ncbi:hypothetical protein GCM10007989_21360 [Devosia pacifica]|uniref:O-antigen ligase n=1 Tax=Devosia pacifica TaxID=1335967 RepID=A0A918S7V0_9HYPH|nr:hypothetical protein [Devosia pacifica]GHA25419.1 hypothetical protein GCM10007989_21360 [Devosia pacifica]
MKQFANSAFTVMVLALPFNGVRPLVGFGELSQEGFFYASLLYLAAMLPIVATRLSFADLTPILRWHWMYLGLILISLPVHLTMMLANDYGGRAGLSRYLLSLSTYAYFFGLAGVMMLHARVIGIDAFLKRARQAFFWLSVLLICVSSLEVIGWALPAAESAFGLLRKLATSAPAETGRLFGLSLEPSFNAFVLLLCLGFATTAPEKRPLLATALIVFCLMSGARTAYFGLLAMALGWLAVRGARRGIIPAGSYGFILVISAFSAGLVLPAFAPMLLGPDQPLSNITRAYLMNAAFETGLTSPIGQGFGQVGYAVVDKVGYAVEMSSELQRFYLGDRFGELPPLFSWYARTFGEFGPFGYILIALSIATAASRLFRIGQKSEDDEGQRLFALSVSLLMSFLAIGFSIGSVRVPHLWLAVVFASLCVAREYQKTPQATRTLRNHLPGNAAASSA